MPSDDRLTVIRKYRASVDCVFEVKKMFPRHSEHLDLLKAKLRNGLFFLNEFVVNPLGIIELTHNDGGLQLIKWTRNIDNT